MHRDIGGVARPDAADGQAVGTADAVGPADLQGKGARRGVLLPGIEGVESAAEQVKIACKKAGISFAEDYTLERFRITKIAEGSGDS